MRKPTYREGITVRMASSALLCVFCLHPQQYEASVFPQAAQGREESLCIENHLEQYTVVKLSQ